MKKLFIVVAVAFAMAGNAFAACEEQEAQRDKFRALCFSVAGISVASAHFGNMIPVAIGPVPLGGIILGGTSGLIAHNQCRIWQEKEHALKKCKDHHFRMQEDEIRRKKDEIDRINAQGDRINQINTHYDQEVATARNNHQGSVRALMARYVQEGRSLRDPLVQAQLRADVQQMETDLQNRLSQIESDRNREIKQVTG
jgi:hypothetical protein